jgi:hypothetical protein
MFSLNITLNPPYKASKSTIPLLANVTAQQKRSQGVSIMSICKLRI